MNPLLMFFRGDNLNFLPPRIRLFKGGLTMAVTVDEVQSRKCKQLCRQVAETLDWVLSGDSRDELLQSPRVAAVEPAPYSSRLLVTVVTDLPAEEVDRQLILDHLQEHAGRLRCEVAASINRRKTPTLVFQVIP